MSTHCSHFIFPVRSAEEARSCFFFFSSRRRHTRCLSDWSSGRVLFRSEKKHRSLPTLSRSYPRHFASPAWTLLCRSSHSFHSATMFFLLPIQRFNYVTM